MPKIKDIETIYSKVKGNNYNNICTEVFDKSHDEIEGKEVFNKYLPMINVENILNTISPTFLILNEYGLEFEINSDICENELLCSLVGTIDTELNLEIIDD